MLICNKKILNKLQYIILNKTSILKYKKRNSTSRELGNNAIMKYRKKKKFKKN